MMADTGRGVVACYPPHRNLAIGRSRARSLKASARNGSRRAIATAEQGPSSPSALSELFLMTGRYEWRAI
jgi:hypothetical protein